MMANLLPDEQSPTEKLLEHQEDQLKDQQNDNSDNKPKKTLIAKASASSFGDLSYDVDVNPIVMSRAPDPLEQYSGNQLKAQDEYFEEQEKKHRLSLEQLARQNGADLGRQKKQKIVRKMPAEISKQGALIQTIMRGGDASQFVKDVNMASDRKREMAHDRVKQQLRTDIEQQVTGADINPRQQALDDQVDVAVDDAVSTGMVGDKATVGAKDSSAGDILESMVTSSKEESVDTGEQVKTVEGQDDNTLGLSDSQSEFDNAIADPVDLLNNIQANFEVTNAEQTLITNANNSQPMINLDLRIGSLPTKLRDKNGFVVDLSKKDIARIKAQLNKRFKKQMTWPVNIKTFNKLMAGNHQKTVDVVETSTAILKGNQIDFSKSVSADSPLKFKAPLSVVTKPNKDDPEKSHHDVEIDWQKAKTPVDDTLARNHLQQIELTNQHNLADYEQDLKLKRENHAKKDLELKQESKNVNKEPIKNDGPELSM